jgi:hypothetical protein
MKSDGKQSVISQMIELFITIAVRTSDPIYFLPFDMAHYVDLPPDDGH